MTARLSSPWELTVKWMRRRPAIAALSAAVFLVGLIGSAGIFWQWRRRLPVRERRKNRATKARLARDEAEAQRKEAKEQEKTALIARDEAKRQREVARRNAYIAHMNLAQREWDDDHVAPRAGSTGG